MKTLPLFALFTIALQGQPVERNLSFQQLQTNAEWNEAATVIRSVGQIRGLTVQPAEKTLAVSGSPAQVELAEWLMARLDRTGNTPGPAPAPLDFKLNDALLRVLYFRNARTPAERNEMATVIRSLVEIPSLFVSQAAGAMVLRGSSDQADAARWAFEALDRATPSASGPYRLAGGEDDWIRIFAMPAAGPAEQFYRLATEVRSELGAKRFYTYSPHRVIAIRGKEELLSRAEARLSRP